MHLYVVSALSLERGQGVSWLDGKSLFLLVVAKRVEKCVDLMDDVSLTFILLFECILIFL